MDDRSVRERMVAEQIAARRAFRSQVLEVMRSVPRHLFVPEAERREAYADRPVAIGYGQTISQPYIVALMTDLLALRPTDRVLEIGTGSGYQTAILCRLASAVVSVERHEPLAGTARQVLASLGIANVQIVVGDGTLGYASGAPYDRILVTAGAPAVPSALREQLSPDGGRMVIPIGPPDLQHLLVVDRAGGSDRERLEEPCLFVPLIGSGGWTSSKG
jgi:protein-L-isoaspartate(D-aspartate) O-methyltransferase